MSAPELANVAAAYKSALYDGGYPKQAVVRTFGVDASTASRWIKQARDAGLIAEHEKGQPGFVPSAETRKRNLVFDAAEAVVKQWGAMGRDFGNRSRNNSLGDLLEKLSMAVES